MNPTKNDFLNNNGIENTYDTVISYTSNKIYTNIVSPKMSWSYFSTKEWNLFYSKEIMNMSALADVLRELPCRICEFLFLKLPCCMKRVRKSKELELYCFTLKHTVSRFVHGFFTFSSTTKCGFDFEVNRHSLKN